ncbi:MAG TPA: methyltransferase domain-containing protein [Thermoanaerobaculia bacterium]|nr:methyltransferase domain-containing protein [Thermoanaerobaculia bacterium]
MSEHVPAPAVMPLDREEWRKQINLSNFVNSYYQYRDVVSCGDGKRILVIGPGQGLDTAVFKWLGYDVTTFDIDATFEPDHIGSVHSMTMFGDKAFDVVIASHVLEHLAIPYLDIALGELARVAKFAVVYLPVAGRHVQLRLIPALKAIDLSLHFDVRNWFQKPDGVTPRYCSGQHFWEIGMRGFRVKDVERRLAQRFEILRSYRNHDWPISYNFVLRAR